MILYKYATSHTNSSQNQFYKIDFDEHIIVRLLLQCKIPIYNFSYKSIIIITVYPLLDKYLES